MRRMGGARFDIMLSLTALPGTGKSQSASELIPPLAVPFQIPTELKIEQRDAGEPRTEHRSNRAQTAIRYAKKEVHPTPP
ncbi:MAG: hypothetical protein MPW15_26175 [Candidatus Manganitrophus sp.]|nr:hypothetical protein [Candidatus Manganitrophus sp.]